MPVCCICKMKDNDPIEYGEFMHKQKSDIFVHYYCLLLSTHLPQKGSHTSGILGFLVRDILTESQKCKKRTCRYCEKPNASIACHKCHLYFHQICGNKNNCVSEFVNEFHSYCHEHVPFKYEEMVTKSSKNKCCICTKKIKDKFNKIQSLGAQCCQNGYVHRTCMRKYALSAGYFLACIWCRKTEFRDYIRKRGVFVPDREANWDNNEIQRYVDLHRRYSQCDAKKCSCPQGRYYLRGMWRQLIICHVCGASEVHNKCGTDSISRGKYTCSTCAEFLINSEKEVACRRNKNTMNYTMFMSKTYEETENFSQRDHFSPKKEKKEVTSKQPEQTQEPQEALKPQESQERQELQKLQEPQKSQEPQEPQEPQEEPQKPKEPLKSQTQRPSTSSSPKEPVVREMYLFDKDSNIIGNVKVEQSKIVQLESGKLTCKEEDILGFSSSDKLLQSIFDDIVAEGRELSMDMVDEVFDRLTLTLETFGDNIG